MNMSLRGKVAIVTGAGGGVGKADIKKAGTRRLQGRPHRTRPIKTCKGRQQKLKTIKTHCQ